MILAVLRVSYQVGLTAVDRGESAESVRRRQRDAIERGFAQIMHGLVTTPYGRTPRRPAARSR